MLDSLQRYWFTYFGEPEEINSDNGIENESLKGWSKEKENIALRWNNTFIAAIQETPQFLMMGEDINENLTEENSTNIDSRNKKWKEHKEKELKEFMLKKIIKGKKSFVVGELIFIQNKNMKKYKFEENEGPCRVTKIEGSSMLVVKNGITV